jgi:N-acetylmuramoyl-L-alanine amidase
MPIRYRIQQGDSVSKLALEFGFFPQTIWEHADNESLRTLRQDMNILLPGDEVVIPDKRVRTERCATGRRHTFRRRGVPMLFRLQVLHLNQPLKNEPYELTVDDKKYQGTTSEDGMLEQYLPNSARSGRLVTAGLEIEIFFGHMDPITELSGVQKRLCNMGFDCGAVNGVMGPRTTAAIRAFQRLIGKQPTGELDAETRDLIAQCHDQRAKLKELAAQRPPGGV